MDPRLACVVMSLGTERGLVPAVRSILAAREPVEVVVVNSGGGAADLALKRAGLEVPLLDVPERLPPGRVRNLGVRATRAPIVSFLAADCVAERGWVGGRLRAHQRHRAVASAVTNMYPGRAAADASYFLLFFTRMPTAPETNRMLYGASYERSLFDELGGFREDLWYGEDNEFNERLIAAGHRIGWAPEVRTAHRHPVTVRALLDEHRRRGARMTRMYRQLGKDVPAQMIARRAMGNPIRAASAVWRYGSRSERRRLLRAASLMLPAAAAYAAGAMGER